MKARNNQRGWWRLQLLVLLLLNGLVFGQEQLPDAPQPQKTARPPATQQIPPPPARPSVPPNAPAPRGTEIHAGSGAASSLNNPEPPPSPAITTVAPGQQPPAEPGSPRDQLFTLTKNVNFVLVPVTVKDTQGHLVEGLLPSDFSVYENGERQKLTFFTSDPFPLSAAVVVDTALPSSQWKKVKESLSALIGAFSQFDELSIFTYGNVVRKVQDFSGVDAELVAQSVRQIRASSGDVGGAPVATGPMTGSPTPSVNGRPFDPSVPEIQTMPKESYVLNDAILRAANDLSQRDLTRRRVVFVISDGREFGSSSSYADVLRVLLTRQISVYAVGIDSGIPGYRQAQKLRIPGMGYGDILPKYASATGGQAYPEVGARAIEDAYARITREARNQYTVGYVAPATPSSAYRSIEVRVDRLGLRVYARDGYYPASPAK